MDSCNHTVIIKIADVVVIFASQADYKCFLLQGKRMPGQACSCLGINRLRHLKSYCLAC